MSEGESAAVLKRWMGPWRVVIIALVLAAALLPLDGVTSQAARAIRPGGDFRRELELLQQFGSPTTLVLAALVIWRVDSRRLRRVLDWLTAAAATWGAVFALKLALGRPRPKFNDALAFLGPWNARVVQEGDPARHAWQFWTPDVTEIWSMPSSHTALAFVAATFLGRLYPRLWPVVLTMACVVGACRVLFRAHYPSDVVVGAALGYALASLAFTGGWGVRGVDWLWRTLVDKRATPAWPAMAREQDHRGAS